MRVIPAIDLMEGRVVRLLKGDPGTKTVYSDDPVGVAKKWQEDGADMIHVVDLDATLGRGSNIKIAREIAETLDIPVQFGGGLRYEDAVLAAFESFDRVVVGTMALRNRAALDRLRDRLDVKRIVVSLDHVDGYIAVSGWQERTGAGLIDTMADLVNGGFSEFLVTNVNRDGTLEGPDVRYLKQACAVRGTNIIASGGISEARDVGLVGEIGPYGVILGKALYEGRITIPEARRTVV